MESCEQVIVFGHIAGGILWLGGPIVISLFVHAVACVLVAMTATRAVKALARTTLRVLRVIRTWITLPARPLRAKAIGKLLFTKSEPPQDDVLVSNATGKKDLDKTIIPALRGGGWNVPTLVDQPMRPASMTTGTSVAAQALSRTFATPLRSGAKTMLLIGTDLSPDTE